MSTIVHPSSSLLTLKQNNDSKSSVSSDTDVDSLAYDSLSSGATTPEDEDKTFHLGLHGSIDKPGTPRSKAAVHEKLTINTRSRNFSTTMKKIKRVALALTVFKKERPDDISPILISSPLRERFGKRMSVKTHPDESFYSLPNRRLSLQDIRTSSHVQPLETITRKYGTVSGSSSAFIRRKKQGSGLPIPSFVEPSLTSSTSPHSMAPRSEKDTLTPNTLLIHILRILLFVPWCAAVGGALLLFPSQVELVTFRTGYIAYPKGLQRFAYWAECGKQHVMIFLAFLVLVLWYRPAMGVSLIAISVSRFVQVWHSFKVDRSIPLGEDDQQSLYIVVTELASADDTVLIHRSNGSKVTIEVDNLEQNQDDIVETDQLSL